MLDEKDIQIISQLLNQQLSLQLSQQKKEIMEELRGEMDTRFAQQKKDIMHEVNLLMESYFDPKFNVLADGLELLKERCVSREELEENSDRIDVLEAVVKVHTREIEKLKKSNHIA